MDLSVIIVSYNVKALLEQTLLSVYKAKQNLNIEIIVIDNNSADDSASMVHERFKDVILIQNNENQGFSRANNQGMKIARGRNVLLLNPDTVLSEDTLVKTVHFLDNTPGAGALGVRMIDGSGKFLPESKRGLPTPMVAFYKMSGLSRVFPGSKTFGVYHLGYLDEMKTNKVDILSGACMMIKSDVLGKVGLFDENFFMYGEDIDLSYRIRKAGYDNYYFADTTIIHYKGESTKKQSINYVKIFYQAMAKFARKHFTKQEGRWFTICINLAIFARAFLAMLVRFLHSTKLFFFDFLLIFSGFYGLMRYWEIYNKYVVGGFYPDIYIQVHVPVYILFWLSSVALSGGYSKAFRLGKTVRGILFGSFFLLAVYALLPENMRFSRALIVLGSVWALLVCIFNRLLYHFILYKNFDTSSSLINNVLVVGNLEKCVHVKQIVLNYPGRFRLLGFIKPNNNNEKFDWLGSAENLPLLAEIYKADEIIFCAGDISSAEIMNTMSKISGKLKYKILPEKSDYIIGSNSKNAQGEFYGFDITPALSNPAKRRSKRIFDIMVCITSILLSPVLIFRFRFFKIIVQNWIACFSGKKTWIGYHPPVYKARLPEIPSSVFFVGHEISNEIKDEQLIYNLNFLYASNYSWQNDLNSLAKAFFSNNFASIN